MWLLVFVIYFHFSVLSHRQLHKVMDQSTTDLHTALDMYQEHINEAQGMQMK